MAALKLLKGALVVLASLLMYAFVPRRLKRQLLVRIAFETAHLESFNLNSHRR